MVGRNTELKTLQQMYTQDGNQLVVLYGRSNIGKGEVLKEFCRGKKVMYYGARQASPQLQRQMMGAEIQRKYNITMQDFSYDTFFKRIRSGDASKLVLIVNDFEFIAKRDEGFMESIVRLKEKKLYPGPVMIILCSSSIAWVENDMVQCLGACAKKVTGVFKIGEIGFVDVVHLFPDHSVSESIQVYGIVGGVPGYLRRWDARKSMKENICMHILSKDGFLYTEAQNYISAELRELSVYNTILEAIASGRRKLNELFQYTGYSRAKISVYLKNLMEFEVVEKVIPFETGGWDNAQKGLYQIKNTYLHFWYKFVYPHLSDLHMLSAEEFYDTWIASEIGAYFNGAFQKVCMEYLELMSMVNQLPIKIHKIGTWVGKQGNIDIIAQNDIRENIVGLCSWSENVLTYEMYQKLLDSMEQARVRAKKYYLFSAGDFDENIKKKAAEDDQIVLVDMNRM